MIHIYCICYSFLLLPLSLLPFFFSGLEGGPFRTEGIGVPQNGYSPFPLLEVLGDSSPIFTVRTEQFL